METFPQKYKRITTESLGSVAIEGEITPGKFVDAQEALANADPSSYILVVPFKQWENMQINSAFAAWLDVYILNEKINTGDVGMLLCTHIITDEFAQPEDRILKPDVSILFIVPKEFQLNVI